MNRLNYEKVFKTLVEETGNYLVNHSLRAMVLGVSGGIDSTVVAAICCEVNKQTNIPLIGRSLLLLHLQKPIRKFLDGNMVKKY